MKRVVITGLGIVSSIGNNADEVLASLKAGKSGITHSESFAEQGLRSNVWGKPTVEIKDHIDRKAVRFMGDAAGYAYIAMDQAVKDAKLTEEQISNVRTGIVAGSGGASSENIVASTDTLRSRGIRRVGPYAVPKTMGSTVSACLAISTLFIAFGFIIFAISNPESKLNAKARILNQKIKAIKQGK